MSLSKAKTAYTKALNDNKAKHSEACSLPRPADMTDDAAIEIWLRSVMDTVREANTAMSMAENKLLEKAGKSGNPNIYKFNGRKKLIAGIMKV